MTFALDLKQFSEKTGKKADAAVSNIVVRVASELDRRSPVGDAKYWKNPPPKGYIGGHFRANWQLGVGDMPGGEVAGVVPGGHARRETAGGAALSRIRAEVPSKASGLIFYLANNVPYAQALEYGHSRQAPAPGGVVGITVAMFNQIVLESIRQLDPMP